jgi:antitoxin component YwqK of YwqJK toxin-antitoxin module
MLNNKLFIIILLFSGCFSFNKVFTQQDTVFNQTDANGLRQGYWRKYYSNGNLIYKGFFKDNKPTGEFCRYYESGALKVRIIYFEGTNLARSTWYYENGALAAKGNYLGTAKDSTWEYYSFYDGSLKSKENYSKGARNGFSYHYYQDGSVLEKTAWKNNEKDGIWEQYYPGGAIKTRGTYKNNKLNGPFYVFREDGGMSVQGFFLDNLRHNKWVFYKGDNTIDLEVKYDYGKPDKEDALTEKQKEILQLIEENQGKYDEPDETNFMQRNIR